MKPSHGVVGRGTSPLRLAAFGASPLRPRRRRENEDEIPIDIGEPASGGATTTGGQRRRIPPFDGGTSAGGGTT